MVSLTGGLRLYPWAGVPLLDSRAVDGLIRRLFLHFAVWYGGHPRGRWDAHGDTLLPKTEAAGLGLVLYERRISW